MTFALPTVDELVAYLEQYPGGRFGEIAAHFFEGEGKPSPRNEHSSYYWSLHEHCKRSRMTGRVVVNNRRWYAVETAAGEAVQPGFVVVAQGEYDRLARQALEVKRRVGQQKHLTAKFSNDVAAIIGQALDEITCAAKDYNQEMRSVEREIQHIANNLQLSKVES